LSLRAAIVGLGRVGLLFDEDEKRSGVWTHFSAYEQLGDRFDLVAVADVDPARRELALARRPSLRAFEALGELLASESVDVVSLCTPTELHAAQIAACAGRARMVVCEKPISGDFPSGEAAIKACTEAGTLVAVNYYKRFETSVREVAQLLSQRAIGDVHAAAALYAGPLDAVGSHAVDLLQFLVGPLTVSHGDGRSALLGFGADGVATLAATGPREDLVFEIDLIGSEGRLRILDNCARFELSRFRPSPRYDGYRELVGEPGPATRADDPFLRHFLEIADVLDGSQPRLTSDAASALRTQRILDRIGNDLDGVQH
jgi:predicted dehydrogenase